jgi:hypothetical protein
MSINYGNGSHVLNENYINARICKKFYQYLAITIGFEQESFNRQSLVGHRQFCMTMPLARGQRACRLASALDRFAGRIEPRSEPRRPGEVQVSFEWMMKGS